MYNRFSFSWLLLHLASVQCENCSHNDKSFLAMPNMPGSIGPKWLRAPATPQLGLNHATSSDIGIPNMFYKILLWIYFFGNKQLILVFLFLFSVALAQNTTGVTTATTMATAGRNGPLAPHMRPGPPGRRVKWMGNNPPSLRMFCFGRLRVFMDLKALLVPAMMNCHNIRVFWGP